MLTYRNPSRLIPSGRNMFLPSFTSGCSTVRKQRFPIHLTKLVPFRDDYNCLCAFGGLVRIPCAVSFFSGGISFMRLHPRLPANCLHLLPAYE
jgi:hypothetical protein